MFENKKVNLQKLLPYGFTRNNNTYTYITNIANGQFQMVITLTEEETVNTKVIDSSSNEYILHRIPEASGPFVSKIRADYENILYHIAEKCFEPNIFKSTYAQKIIQHVKNTYHDELEFLWPKFPNNAIFRRKDTNKWYAALLVISKRKLGLNSDEIIDIIDLKTNSKEIARIVDDQKYFPGYHMNKKHWYTICLAGSVSLAEILQRIDTSYKLSTK
jgi:predicted DNA-binding protein (MmcQ/YjbR family)